MRCRNIHITAILTIPALFTPVICPAGEYIVPDDFTTIQEAINAAVDSDTILVADGEYVYDGPAGSAMIDFKSKAITVKSMNGPEHCVLKSLNLNRGCLECDEGERNTSLFEGFHIHGFRGGAYPAQYAMPVRIYQSSPVIRNCIFSYISGIDVEMIESGIYVSEGPEEPVRFEDCQFLNCWSTGGGVMTVDNANAVFLRCVFKKNSALSWVDPLYGVDEHRGFGGAVDLWGGSSNAVFQQCIFANNTAEGANICVEWYHDPPNEPSCLKREYRSGGGAAISGGRVEIINCTFYGNDADGGPICFITADSVIKNSIFWANVDTDENDPVDPLLADPDSGNYHLKSQYGRWDEQAQGWVHDDVTSPCIDAGDPNDLGWQNELWPHGGRINMGPYGGTPQASMSPSTAGYLTDLDFDDTVGPTDLERFAEDWLRYEALLQSDFNRDNRVTLPDFTILAEWWMQQ
jgi:hypothetical protein